MGMSISFKKETKMTNIKHNNRKMNEQEKERNSHIDFSKSHENKYLLQESLKELYKREFDESLEKYNAKQKRSDRKIKDYYRHIQASKKTALQQEMIIQIGDKDDFSSKENVQAANEILEKWFRTFEERNPNLKIYNAVIHNDEASPHLHVNFVPVASGYRRGLEKQVSFDKAILQQDYTLSKERPFDDWREKEVQLLEKMLNERGIERELIGTNEYKDVTEYKEKKRELVKIEKEIEDLKTVLPEKKEPVAFLRKETETEVKPKMIGKPEITERETGNYVLSPEQYKAVTEQIHAAVTIQKDYNRLKNMDFAKEREELLEVQGTILDQFDSVYQREQELKKENKALREENTALKGRVGQLQANLRLIYQNTRETLRERFGAFREHLNNDMKKNKVVNYFEKIHKQVQVKDRGIER
ncbi:plasmid recombination protein [Domibacillus indicus]|uniref:plasmid recombination protein n=1 Tax=Domibacillus indicus TaxID=1437523 RepID=UPI0006182BFF|nr:plasmid recombination protein [Domibacillus indicus]